MNGKQFEVYIQKKWNSQYGPVLHLDRGAKMFRYEERYFNHKLPLSKKLALLYKHTKNTDAIKRWFGHIKRGIEDYYATFPASYPDFVLFRNGKPIAFVEVKYKKHIINIPQLIFHLYLAEKYNMDYYILTDDGLYKPIGKVVKVPFDPWDLSVLPTIKFDFSDGKIAGDVFDVG